MGDEPKKAVVLAHLSDLHFGARGQSAAWEILAQRLRDSPPDLVLVTGDLVESPTEKHFRAARKAMDELRIRYYVCPGNHDRYARGLRWFRQPRKLFEASFSGRTLEADRVTDEPVGPWTLGLSAVDSSLQADYFARGFVPQLTMGLVRAARSDKSHFRIVLIHHHLQSIPRLEERGRHLTDATTLVNAGQLLEALAEAGADLVLHGHEHAPHLGGYTSLALGRREIAIVGAGSAVGARTWPHPCDPKQMSYNEISIEKDRSVSVTVVSNEENRWASQTPVGLFMPAAARRAAMFRRYPNLRAQIWGQITKCVEFQRDRTILVNWAFFKWPAGKDAKFEFPVLNSTGYPIDAQLTFRGTEAPIDLETDQDPNGGWLLRGALPDSALNREIDYNLSFKWRHGAILEERELKAVKKTLTVGTLRSEGFEFSSVWTNHPVASVQLILVVPREFDPGMVQVRVLDAAHKRLEDEEGEVRERVWRLGDGRYSFTVPYPTPGRRYALAWKPRRTKASVTHLQFAQMAKKRGPGCMVAAAKGAERAFGRVRLCLLLQENSNAACSGHHSTGGTGNAGHVYGLSLTDPKPIDAAFRGEIVMEPSSTSPWLAEPDELLLIHSPLSFNLGWNNPSPWGVLRVGLLDQAGLSRFLNNGDLDYEKIRATIASVSLVLLSALSLEE